MKEEGLTGLYYDYALAAPVMAGMNEKADSQVMILGPWVRYLCRLLQPVFPGSGDPGGGDR